MIWPCFNNLSGNIYHWNTRKNIFYFRFLGPKVVICLGRFGQDSRDTSFRSDLLAFFPVRQIILLKVFNSYFIPPKYFSTLYTGCTNTVLSILLMKHRNWNSMNYTNYLTCFITKVNHLFILPASFPRTCFAIFDCRNRNLKSFNSFFGNEASPVASGWSSYGRAQIEIGCLHSFCEVAILGAMLALMRGYLFSFPNECLFICFNCFYRLIVSVYIAKTRANCIETNELKRYNIIW